MDAVYLAGLLFALHVNVGEAHADSDGDGDSIWHSLDSDSTRLCSAQLDCVLCVLFTDASFSAEAARFVCGDIANAFLEMFPQPTAVKKFAAFHGVLRARLMSLIVWFGEQALQPQLCDYPPQWFYVVVAPPCFDHVAAQVNTLSNNADSACHPGAASAVGARSDCGVDFTSAAITQPLLAASPADSATPISWHQYIRQGVCAEGI
jgi:hypothetical protein